MFNNAQNYHTDTDITSLRPQGDSHSSYFTFERGEIYSDLRIEKVPTFSQLTICAKEKTRTFPISHYLTQSQIKFISLST